jgi:hypothetical protein
MTENLLDSKSFFEFEEKHRLFELKHKNIFLWDIVRSDIYFKLLWTSKDVITTEKRKTGKSVFFKEISLFIYSIVFNKYNYLFFTASRSKDENQFFFDQNLQDLINQYPDAKCFENYQREVVRLKNKKSTIFNPINLIQTLGGLFYRNYDYADLANLINEHYKSFRITGKEIGTLITQFKIDFNFYYFVFKLKKPKVIFITQNGIQKGLFAAAKELNIPVIEVQHGIIDEGHLTYNYNRSINYNGGRVYLPTYFFTFSDFWEKEIFYPVKEILSIGNSYYFNSIYKARPLNAQEGILVVSSDVFGEQLKELVLDFSRKSVIPIYFKLHPNQYYQKDYYINSFKEFDNVQVYTDEKSLHELIEISNAVLVIQSTAVYEALHLKRIGIIFKRQTFTRHKHIFSDKNVYLIDNSEELNDVFGCRFIEDTIDRFNYFENFDIVKFEKFRNILKNRAN